MAAWWYKKGTGYISKGPGLMSPDLNMLGYIVIDCHSDERSEEESTPLMQRRHTFVRLLLASPHRLAVRKQVPTLPAR